MLFSFAARPADLGESGWIGGWSPGIGDPTLLGWVTVVAYFATAWLCHRVQARAFSRSSAPASVQTRERWLWRAFVVLLVALGINKQLDLQSAMTQALRILARAQGWYDYRREYQRVFIEIMAVVGVVGGAWLIVVTRRMPSPTKIAGLGLCFIGVFVLVRATSFHYMDALIHYEVLSLRLNWILELGGIGVIAFGAWRRIRANGAGALRLRRARVKGAS